MTDTSTELSAPLYGASFGQAINRFFKKYGTFSGRASRSEYWWVVLALVIFHSVFAVLFLVAGGVRAYATPQEFTVGAVVVVVLWVIVELAIIIPSIAVTVRRLHDGNFSGWFYLLYLVGLSIVVFILTLLESKPEGARFDK